MWHMGGARVQSQGHLLVHALSATIAITGFIPFAGVFSKDAILFAAYQSEKQRQGVLCRWGLLAAIFDLVSTCSGLVWLTFGGEKRYDEQPRPRPRIARQHDRAADDSCAAFAGWRLVRRAALWGGPNYFAGIPFAGFWQCRTS